MRKLLLCKPDPSNPCSITFFLCERRYVSEFSRNLDVSFYIILYINNIMLFAKSKPFPALFQIGCTSPVTRQRNPRLDNRHTSQISHSPRQQKSTGDFTSQLSKLFAPFSLFPSNRARSKSLNHHPARRRPFLRNASRTAPGSRSTQPLAIRNKRKNSVISSKFAKKIQTVHTEIKFSCKNRPPGYYADVNEGCQVGSCSTTYAYEMKIDQNVFTWLIWPPWMEAIWACEGFFFE